jgi:transcriptional regulator with PAS, ATPase and Fis domain
VAVNCGALPEGILESELFGHVKGAFTGAVRDKKGRFELAHGGTIFLDEVAELSAAMQVALLRVLQERTVQPVGGEKTIHVDVRVISATNRNLRQMMEQGVFRRDLFYRLCVVPIELPPLRERHLDIALLTDHFLEVVAQDSGRQLLTVSPPAIEALTRYPWPGNVRELRNALEYAYVKCHTGSIEPAHLPPEIREHEDKPAATPGPAPKLSRDQIVVALAKAGGNKKKAAALLGVGRATLYRSLSKFELS